MGNSILLRSRPPTLAGRAPWRRQGLAWPAMSSFVVLLGLEQDVFSRIFDLLTHRLREYFEDVKPATTAGRQRSVTATASR